jgi:hypothetical protein
MDSRHTHTTQAEHEHASIGAEEAAERDCVCMCVQVVFKGALQLLRKRNR